MKNFKDFTSDKLLEAKDPGTVLNVKHDAFKNGPADNQGLFGKAVVSGGTLKIEFTDGRSIQFKDAGDIIAASGVKTGQYVGGSFSHTGLKSGSGDYSVKYSKTGKYIEVSSDGVRFSIETGGNKQWQQTKEGGWAAFSGGAEGMGKYKISALSGPTSGMPRPGETIEFTNQSGSKDSGEVLDLNGALKQLTVKDSKGKKVKVSMYIK